MAAIRDASEDDWELLRTIRLLALQDAPLAFASTYDHEAGRGERWWRGWLRSELWLLAFEDGIAPHPIGMITAGREPQALAREDADRPMASLNRVVELLQKSERAKDQQDRGEDRDDLECGAPEDYCDDHASQDECGHACSSWSVLVRGDSPGWARAMRADPR